MSIQPFADPHPGRCKNVRPSNDGERDTSRRCIEMDGHDSRCRFKPQPVRATGYDHYTIGTQPPPVPWVVPDVATHGTLEG